MISTELRRTMSTGPAMRRSGSIVLAVVLLSGCATSAPSRSDNENIRQICSDYLPLHSGDPLAYADFGVITGFSNWRRLYRRERENWELLVDSNVFEKPIGLAGLQVEPGHYRVEHMSWSRRFSQDFGFGQESVSYGDSDKDWSIEFEVFAAEEVNPHVSVSVQHVKGTAHASVGKIPEPAVHRFDIGPVVEWAPPYNLWGKGGRMSRWVSFHRNGHCAQWDVFGDLRNVRLK